MPDGKYFRFRSRSNPDFYMDVRDGKLKAMNEVILREHSQAEHQLWFEDTAFHVIRNKGNPDLVLEENEDGIIIINNFETKKRSQEWIIKENCVCRRDDASRVIAPVMDEFRIGLTVVAFTDITEEKWDFINLPANDIVILSEVNGKALTISSEDCSVGSDIIIQKNKGTQNQIWYEDKYGVIRSKLNGFTFDVKSPDGTMVVVDVQPDFEGAEWIAHEGSIINRHNPQQCVQLSNIVRENGNLAEKAQYNGNTHQKWKFDEI